MSYATTDANADSGDPERRPGATEARGDPDVAPAVEAEYGPLARMQARVRSNASLTGLFILALLCVMHFAAPVFLPFVVALLLALVLSPPLRLLTNIGIPTPLAAGLVVTAFVAIVGSTFYALSGPAADWIEQLPRNLKAIERKLEVVKGPIEEVTQATQEVEKLATLESETTQVVEIRQPGFLRITLRSTPPVIVSTAITFVLLYFMLGSGREIVRKLARPRSLQWNRRQLIAIVRDVESDMSRYLFTVTGINAGLGLATGIMLHLFGMPNAAMWGVVVAVLNYAPYVGATISTCLIAAVGLLTFEHAGHGLLPAAVFVALAFVEGQVLTPAIVGRRLSLSPLLVFLAVIVCAWMWGVLGALIAVPLLACIKIVCQHVPEWTKVAEIIGR